MSVTLLAQPSKRDKCDVLNKQSNTIGSTERSWPFLLDDLTKFFFRVKLAYSNTRFNFRLFDSFLTI